MKKFLFNFILCSVFTFAFCASVYASSSISITKAEQNANGAVEVECSIQNAEQGQNITVLSTSLDDETYVTDLTYIDQFIPEISSGNTFTFNFQLADWTDTVKAYIVKVGGDNIDTPDTKIIAFYDGSTILAGDVNRDGKVDNADAAMLLKYISSIGELTPTQIALSDYDSDCELGLDDVVLIMQNNQN